MSRLIASSASASYPAPPSWPSLASFSWSMLYRTKRHRQSCRGLAAPSRDQLLVSDAASYRRIYKTIEPVQGVRLNVAVVQAERKFINITAQMLVARMVIDAMQTALQHGPNAFDAVGAHAISDVLARTVVDGFVSIEHRSKTAIACMLVCMQRSAKFDIGMDVVVQCARYPSV